MKSYIVYDAFGTEIDIIKAGSHNSAEKKAKKKYPLYLGIWVVYTEV